MTPCGYTYLSLGAGVQSTCLLVCSNLDLHGVPRAEVAIFADTQCEPPWVYKQVTALKAWSKIPVEVVTAGNLAQDIVERHSGKRARFAAIPAWTLGADGRPAPLRRQCTREYKVEPIEQKVRALLGYKPRQRVKHQVRCMIGISTDEFTRAKPSRTKWVEAIFPLLDARLSRTDCKRIVQENGLLPPFKSACIICPYHCDDYWRTLRGQFPETWQDACEWDEKFRDMSRSGVRQPVYLHRSLQPLCDVDFDLQKTFVWNEDCDGLCGL